MPISLKYNCTFIHIPKTGGSTIETLLNMKNKACFWDDKGALPLGRFKTINGVDFALQHYTGQMLQKEMPKFYNNSYVFTFCRNPYTRILSSYFWETKETKETKFNPSDFNKWVSSWLKKIDTDHKLPQMNFFVAGNNIYFGKYERFSKDLKIIFKKIGASFPQILINKNHSLFNKEGLIPKINNSSKELIYKTYLQDFVQFNYSNK